MVANTNQVCNVFTLRGHSVEVLRGFEIWLRASGRRPIPTDRILRTAVHYLKCCDDDRLFDRRSLLSYLSQSSLTVKRITLRNRYDHLKVLCRYAEGEGLARTGLMDTIPRPQVGREESERAVTPITRDLVDRLLAVCRTWSWIGLRDQALLLLLWDTPLRASELCSLLESDVDWELEEVRVRDGKGGCRYEAPFSAETSLALSRYLIHRPKKGEHLFATEERDRLSPACLAELLRRVSKRAQVRPPVFAHQFRHSYRIRMRGLGLDDVDVSALMGHRWVQSSASYGRAVVRQQAKSHLREKLATHT